MNLVVKIPLICALSLHFLTVSCNTSQKKSTVICNTPPIAIDTRFPNREQDTAFETVSSLNFTAEGLITLSGWVRERQNPKTDSELPIFRAVQFDLEGNQVVSSNKALQPIAKVKCSGDCNTIAFAESPNRDWQLARVISTTSTQPELWLLGKERQLQIVKPSPYDLKWEWSKDGSLIWLTWAAIGSGRESYLIWLDDLKSVRSSSNSQINPTSHRISFSPADEELLLADSNANYIANGKVQRIDLQSKSLMSTSVVTLSNNLIDIFWNPASSEHLFVFAETSGLSFKSENGREILKLSKTNFDKVYGKMGSAIRNYFSNNSLFAISPSQTKLAIFLGNLYIFRCTTEAI